MIVMMIDDDIGDNVDDVFVLPLLLQNWVCGK